MSEGALALRVPLSCCFPPPTQGPSQGGCAHQQGPGAGRAAPGAAAAAHPRTECWPNPAGLRQRKKSVGSTGNPRVPRGGGWRLPCPSSTHLCGCPHLLVQAVAVEGVWGPGEHCRHTEGSVRDAPRWDRTLLLAAGAILRSPALHGAAPALPRPPSPLPAASRMKLAFLFSCRTNWGEPWEQVCSRIFSTWLGGQGQVTAALPGVGVPSHHPPSAPSTDPPST